MRGTLQREHGRLRILEPKTANSVREVAIGQLGAEALRAHRRRQAEERLRLGTSWADLNLAFPNDWGDYMNPEWSAAATSASCCAVAGLRKVRFHDLRHTSRPCS